MYAQPIALLTLIFNVAGDSTQSNLRSNDKRDEKVGDDVKVRELAAGQDRRQCNNNCLVGCRQDDSRTCVRDCLRRDCSGRGITNTVFYDLLDSYFCNDPYSYWSDIVRVYGELAHWDVSSVTRMHWAFSPFRRKSRCAAAAFNAFNEDLSMWDVSSVRDMSHMFHGATSFNNNIVGWDLAQVTDMRSMFELARGFNQDVSMWDVSNVSDMSSMFKSASSFNYNLADWDVSSVRDMSFMFQDASTFNQNLCDWGRSISARTSVTDMFDSAGACPQQGDPILSDNPIGPLCYSCRR